MLCIGAREYRGAFTGCQTTVEGKLDSHVAVPYQFVAAKQRL